MRMYVLVILTLCSLTLVAQDFNVVSFGAVADGSTINTTNIQKAIDAAAEEGGRVVIPAGVFLTGSIIMKSGVELHLSPGATLLGSTNREDYQKLNRWRALILADGQQNIGISGQGVIDGQGRKLALGIDSLFYAGEIDSNLYNFVEMRPKFYLRPQLIEFVDCQNITVRDVTLKNAACWVQTHDRCENIIIENVRTESDAYWNNDGIDISDCKNVRISNCYVNSADDGICLKSHAEEYLCDSILIENCVVRSSASAVKFGTRSHGGFRNVVIRNIKVYDTFRSAIAIESVDGGILEDILVDGMVASNTGNAIFIRLGKRNKEGSVGTLKNIVIKNLDVEVAFERPDYDYEIRGPALPFFHNTFPASITGIPGHYVENVTLENIRVTYPGRGNSGLANAPVSRLEDVPEKIGDYPEFSMFGELPAWGLYARHVKGLTLKNISMNIEEPDYRPAMVFDDAQKLTIEKMEIGGDDKPEHIVLKDVEEVNIDSNNKVLKIE